MLNKQRAVAVHTSGCARALMKTSSALPMRPRGCPSDQSGLLRMPAHRLHAIRILALQGRVPWAPHQAAQGLPAACPVRVGSRLLHGWSGAEAGRLPTARRACAQGRAAVRPCPALRRPLLATLPARLAHYVGFCDCVTHSAQRLGGCVAVILACPPAAPLVSSPLLARPCPRVSTPLRFCRAARTAFSSPRGIQSIRGYRAVEGL